MNTECTPDQLEFQGFRKQKIIVKHDAEISSSDGGLLLLREVEYKYSIIKQLSNCFGDNRNPSYVQHSLKTLLTQRIFGLVLGYEDLNDHDQWRSDPLLALACGIDTDKIAAGKSTLNRLELGKEITEEYGARYNKISWDDEQIEDLFIKLFLDNYKDIGNPMVLDFDATDDPLHGDQEGKFFHGYYDSYCYLPLYVFCGEYLLAAKLRTSSRDGSDGTVEILEKMIPMIRERFPDIQIIVRGDSGFCREKIMCFCEDNNLDYIFGLARNKRLHRAIAGNLKRAKALYDRTDEAQRIFCELKYKTRKSWSRTRRVVGKAEYLRKGENPRFVVTSLPILQWPGKELYEDLYCARGDMENRIKEQQLYLFADRTSTAWMSSNQLRLWFSSFAYMFFVLLRTEALTHTDLKKAQAVTLRLKILKVAAIVKVSTRRILIRLPSAYPYWGIWTKAYASGF